jgi:hypothetical protein
MHTRNKVGHPDPVGFRWRRGNDARHDVPSASDLNGLAFRNPSEEMTEPVLNFPDSGGLHV